MIVALSQGANFHDAGQRPGSWKTSTLNNVGKSFLGLAEEPDA
jgi:hypothetical protein